LETDKAFALLILDLLADLCYKLHRLDEAWKFASKFTYIWSRADFPGASRHLLAHFRRKVPLAFALTLEEHRQATKGWFEHAYDLAKLIQKSFPEWNTSQSNSKDKLSRTPKGIKAEDDSVVAKWIDNSSQPIPFLFLYFHSSPSV